MDRAASVAGLAHQPSHTAELRLHGWTEKNAPPGWDRVYGADLPKLNELSASEPELAAPLHPDLPFRKAEAIWAARFEMARTVEDVLARRTRALFLNARAAIEAAEETARLLARELRRDPAWEHQQTSQFRALAEGYLWTPAHSG